MCVKFFVDEPEPYKVILGSVTKGLDRRIVFVNSSEEEWGGGILFMSSKFFIFQVPRKGFVYSLTLRRPHTKS